MSRIEEVRSLLDAALRELDHEASVLRGVIATLTESESNATPPPTAAVKKREAPSSKAPAAKTRQGSANVVLSGVLEKFLAAHDGISTTELANLTGGAKDQILTLLKDLEGAGKARRTGEKRATRWHLTDPIDHDDYVNRRAAELERLSEPLPTG